MPTVWSARLMFVVPLLLAACNNGGTASSADASETESGTASMTTTTNTPDSSTTGACEVGMQGCPCTGGGACDPGLTCNADKVCEGTPELTSSSEETTVDPLSTSTTTGTGNDEGNTSTGGTESAGPECTPTGDALESAECLKLDPNRPFCQGDTCVGCGALQADACIGGTEGARPICLPEGRCVQCDSADALALGQCSADAPHCNLATNACEGCFEHSECPETACEVEARTCFPADQIIYVRQGPTPNAPCSAKLGSGGTMQMPYCDFETAILSVQLNGFSTGYTFHLMGNDEAIGDPGSVIITGGDVPVAYAFTHDMGGLLDKHTRFKGTGPLIVVPNNVTLYLREWGVIINQPQGESSRGIDCQDGGAVWLDDSRVLYAKGSGIRGEGCDIHLRRSIIAFGSTEAIEMTGGSLHAVNSFITSNSNIKGKGGGGVHLFGDGATVDMVYTTIADNSNEPPVMPGQFGDSIQCDGNASVKIRNSIIARKPANNNPSIVCPNGSVTVDWSVVDGEIEGNNKQLAAEDILMGLTQVGLTGAYMVNAEGAAMFATQARWQAGDPWFDYDLAPRNAVVDGEDFAGADVYP